MKFDSPEAAMQHALTLARQGFGHVEPNPMVGAVITSPDGTLIASGFHQRFGEAHAEIHAIAAAAGQTCGNDLYVTLEPCSHFGKTPPCADAVVKAGFRKVLIGCGDPAPHVAGNGIRRLRDAGIDVVVGVCEDDATTLIAPFRRQILERRPWVHAKWAMTLDGRIATRTGHSQWISCPASRSWVHDLRGRVEAIITGAGTVRTDDPQLTARPPGPRTPLRVVFDSTGTSLQPDSKLIRSLQEAPVLACTGGDCTTAQRQRLQSMGVEVLQNHESPSADIRQVLCELGRRGMTHVLLECGPGLLGAFFEAEQIDEAHVFVAPKLIGGTRAPGPLGGTGLSAVPDQPSLVQTRHQLIGTDLLIEGYCRPADKTL